MTPRQFMEEVYEIAYGDQAYYRGFFPEEVLETLREFSDNALKVEELSLEPEQYEDMDRQLEDAYRRGYQDGRKFLYQQEKTNETEYYNTPTEYEQTKKSRHCKWVVGFFSTFI